MDDRERWFVHIYQATYVDTHRALSHLVAKHPILRNEFDEILEDTYLEAIRHYEKLKQHSNIAAWIIVTMKNKAKTRCREKRRVLDRLGLRVEVDDDFSMVADNVTPEHIYIEKETGEGLRRSIVRLIGEDGYAILMAHYDQKISIRALAAQYDTTPGALKMRIHRWKKRIARELGEGRRRLL